MMQLLHAINCIVRITIYCFHIRVAFSVLSISFPDNIVYIHIAYFFIIIAFYGKYVIIFL